MISLRGVQRAVVTRLLIAWVLLSLLIGSASLYQKHQRIDDLVLNQAMSASQALRTHIDQLEATHAELLKDSLSQLLQQNFVQVQITDLSGKLVAEAARPDQASLLSRLTDPHSLPVGVRSHRVEWFADELVVQIMVTLQSPSGKAVGHFYGAYRVDDSTRRQAQWELAGAVLAVLLAMLAATAVLYPVIMGLNKGVLRLSTELMRSNIELMEVLGSAIAKRDSDTDLHNYRVCLYSIRFAQALGLADKDIRAVIAGAFLHDVGKIGISDTILLKPGKLSVEEFAVMKTHVQIGIDIVAQSAWLKDARDVIEFHHERFDGKGYLQGLTGEKIPLAARLFAIVDVFDALTSRRPYKKAFAVDTAMDVLAENRGSHFDPHLLDVFAKLAIETHAEFTGLPKQELRERLRNLVTRYFFEGRDDSQASGRPE